MTPAVKQFYKKLPWRRCFSSASIHREIRDIVELPPRIRPRYQETQNHDLLGLHWPSPPRNILLTKKDHASQVSSALVEFAKHIHSSYPDISIILEPSTVQEFHESLPFPVYANVSGEPSMLHDKVDLMSTLGGDGTILRASSLFSSAPTVPPILSFSMGTLGFLGEWKFKEYKRAFREVYMSGADLTFGSAIQTEKATELQEELQDSKKETMQDLKILPSTSPAGWSTIRGKYMGASRTARVLVRNRLKVGIFSPNGERVSNTTASDSALFHQSSASASALSEAYEATKSHPDSDIYAMNEVILHRGATPHLTIIEISVGGRFLTEAVADGMIISTPTGSTAYSLSCGGSIVHPLVPSVLLTPICPRSLSFRSLVLPANTPITLKLSDKNRGREVDVSVDGMRRGRGLEAGMELRVTSEEVRDKASGEWIGGVPSVVRGTSEREEVGGEDSWVGGLNGLLKFNYPFGEEV